MTGRVFQLPDLLDQFRQAGVLTDVDAYGAATIGRIVGEESADVLLAAALAVRGTRFGHVCIDLAGIQNTVVVEGGDQEAIDALPWPELETWQSALSASPLFVSDGLAPLVSTRNGLYLQRYFDYEQRLFRALADRATEPGLVAGSSQVGAVLDGLFPAQDGRVDLQRLAVAAALTGRLTVIAGGPGTGKTTTIGKLLMALASLPGSVEMAVAAPTGKAAARLTEAIHEGTEDLDPDHPIRVRLARVEASTIHRLLGFHPARGKFRYGPDRPLPHDLVILDETSMVSLPLAAKLLDAMRPDASLVLVGDPDQLESIEAGTVLGDIVGPVGGGTVMSSARRLQLAELVPGLAQVEDESAARTIGDAVVVLERVHRFGEDSPIADLADAIRAGDEDKAVDILRSSPDALEWIPEVENPDEGDPVLWEAVLGSRVPMVEAAMRGEAEEALRLLAEQAVLCAHRRGPYGVGRWVPAIERRIQAELSEFKPSDEWHVGRPAMVTRNDYRLNVYNGDIGVTVASGDGLVVAFPGDEGPRLISPARLSDIQTVHAMTIHKSQGSQFAGVAVILPEPTSRLLTRELFYTAVTRASNRVTIVGKEESIRTAISRRVARASGLRELLWGDS